VDDFEVIDLDELAQHTARAVFAGRNLAPLLPFGEVLSMLPEPVGVAVTGEFSAEFGRLAALN
jgi:hypothetical protein